MILDLKLVADAIGKRRRGLNYHGKLLVESIRLDAVDMLEINYSQILGPSIQLYVTEQSVVYVRLICRIKHAMNVCLGEIAGLHIHATPEQIATGLKKTAILGFKETKYKCLQEPLERIWLPMGT